MIYPRVDKQKVISIRLLKLYQFGIITSVIQLTDEVELTTWSIAKLSRPSGHAYLDCKTHFYYLEGNPGEFIVAAKK